MSSTSDEVGHTLDLDAIEARANSAARGPWTVEEDWTAELTDADGLMLGKLIYPACAASAAFIAHARTDIPALVAECRSLRNSHDSLVKALEVLSAPKIREPKRSDYGSDDAYWEACGAWRMILKARALSQAKGGK